MALYHPMPDVTSIFDCFIRYCGEASHLGDRELCEAIRSSHRDGVNPILATESDIEMKFGAFLQKKLPSERLCVHSQIRI
jgi:hypothetical protein